MKSIFLLVFLFISFYFLSGCGGYLPSAPSNWSANPSEMHVWEPPDEETLARRRENQQYLDNLTGEIERLFINHASIVQQESTMDDLTRKTDANIRKTDRDFSNQINNELERNKKMRADLQETRVKYEAQKEMLKKLSEIKPPIIFSSADYNTAMKAFSDGDYTKSIKKFKKLMLQNPPKFLEDNIHFGLGSSFYRLKKYDKAKMHFQKIIDDFEMGDKRFNSYAMLGVIHNLKGEKSRALYLLDEALSSNPPEKIKPLLKRLIKNINDDSAHASN